MANFDGVICFHLFYFYFPKFSFLLSSVILCGVYSIAHFGIRGIDFRRVHLFVYISCVLFSFPKTLMFKGSVVSLLPRGAHNVTRVGVGGIESMVSFVFMCQ